MLNMTEMKSMIRSSLGTPASNYTAAAQLAGTEFTCTNLKGVTVKATILPEVSAHGKVQARLSCAVAGCTKTHDREMSDWHQAMNCRDHGAVKAAGVALTPELKAARQLAAAQATIARLTGAATAAAAAEAAASERAEMDAVLYG